MPNRRKSNDWVVVHEMCRRGDCRFVGGPPGQLSEGASRGTATETSDDNESSVRNTEKEGAEEKITTEKTSSTKRRVVYLNYSLPY